MYNFGINTVEVHNTAYPISLTVSPSCTVSGTLSANTISGVASFESLQIRNAGSFTITATSSVTHINSVASNLFTVSTYVNSISLSSLNTSPSVNFGFVVTAVIYAYDNSLYTGSVTISLTGNNLSGTLSSTEAASQRTFNVYMTVAGTFDVTATAPATSSFPMRTSVLSITVYLPILTITSFTPVYLI